MALVHTYAPEPGLHLDRVQAVMSTVSIMSYKMLQALMEHREHEERDHAQCAPNAPITIPSTAAPAAMARALTLARGGPAAANTNSHFVYCY